MALVVVRNFARAVFAGVVCVHWWSLGPTIFPDYLGL